MQGPEQYLPDLGISLPCCVDPSKTAVLDVAHRALVNYEAYYVSDDAAMKTFLAEPYRFTGNLTDPVTIERFVPTAESPKREHMGRLFYFASNETATTFDTDPMKYGMPMPGMREKKPAS